MLRLVKLNNFIHEDYISDLTICDKLIKWFHSKEKSHSHGALLDSISGERWVEDPKEKDSTDYTFKAEHGSLLQQQKKILEPYLVELQIILKRYLTMYAYSDNVGSFSIMEPINIQHYKPTQAYRTFHFERGGSKYTVLRHLVFQTYLNTVGDGGETEFFYQQYKCKAVKGKTVIWPVDWTHTHRGIVAPTEDKYIITGWYSFDKV